MSENTITGEEIQEAHEKIREVLRGLVWLSDVVKATLFPSREGLVFGRDRDALTKGLAKTLPRIREVFGAGFRLPRGCVEVFTVGTEPVVLCGRRGINGHEAVLRVAGEVAGLLDGFEWDLSVDARAVWDGVLKPLDLSELQDFDAVLSQEFQQAAKRSETSDQPSAEADEKWSKSDSPSRWARQFGVCVKTLKRRIKAGTVRARMDTSRLWRIHVDDLPKDRS